MTPGQQFKPEDILAIAQRRAVAALIPFIVVTAVAVVVIHRLPNRYRSETAILVVPQRVPESYVRATVTTRIDDRLRTLNQQVASRTQLEPVIREFNLYPDLVKTGLMEEVTERMRRDIDVRTIRGDAFYITFTADDPRTAMRVTERLASMYIDENLREREVFADGTNQFLDSQLAEAKARLIEHEDKLAQYKNRNAGQLPTQMQTNLQLLQSAQMQMQALADSIARDADRRMLLESSQGDAPASLGPAAGPSPASPASAVGAPPRLVRTAAMVELETAKQSLESMRQRLKPEHPDVLHLTRTVAELQKKVDDEAAQLALGTIEPAAVKAAADPVEAARLTRYTQTQTEIQSLGQQIAQKEQELTRLRGVQALYQARVDASPAREAELTELMRDYETIQRGYTSLLTKKEEAQVAANLERHEIGEQFKILDPARLPERPFSPDRPRLYALGTGLGLAIGIVFAGILEYRDRSLRSSDDVVAALALPVLAMIPEIITAEDRRSRIRRRIQLSLATVGMVVLAGSVLVWILRA